MNSFFDDRKAKFETYLKIRGKSYDVTKLEIPEGLFIPCDNCHEPIFKETLVTNYYVCPNCNFHFRIPARKRISLTTDTFEELYGNLETVNPLDFPDYEKKVENYQKETGQNEAFLCGIATISEETFAIGVLDSFFMMGSMGSVVGEKVTRLIEYATIHQLPLVIFSASGGARMQEGIFSLMQMAKTSAAVTRHSAAGLLYISVLTDPTTGGVLASFASLGDVIIAESDALIGFAGKRVIEQTIKQELPVGFQSAGFQMEKGFADLISDRKDLKNLIYRLLRFHRRKE